MLIGVTALPTVLCRLLLGLVWVGRSVTVTFEANHLVNPTLPRIYISQINALTTDRWMILYDRMLVNPATGY